MRKSGNFGIEFARGRPAASDCPVMSDKRPPEKHCFLLSWFGFLGIFVVLIVLFQRQNTALEMWRGHAITQSPGH